MAAAFAQSMRALEADRGRWMTSGLILVFILLGSWGGWFTCARVTVYAFSQNARLEVDRAGHPIATSVSGRVASTHLVLGREVQSGEILIELDAKAPRLQLQEARVELVALQAQRRARQQELQAEEVARESQQHASLIALSEASARYREAQIGAQAAAEQASIFARLHRRGLVSHLERLRTQAVADEKRAAAEALHLKMGHLEQEQLTQDNDRMARLAQFRRELTQIDGAIQTAEAALERLASIIDQSRIRAPITGHLGEVADLKPGAVVQSGDVLGVVLPRSPLQVVAYFSPGVALGRIRSGQPARVRLTGFPWAQYGSLAATVARVAHETRNGAIRVELKLTEASPTDLPLQHGLPGTAEIAVERMSPSALVLQAVGKHLNASTPSRVVDQDKKHL